MDQTLESYFLQSGKIFWHAFYRKNYLDSLLLEEKKEELKRKAEKRAAKAAATAAAAAVAAEGGEPAGGEPAGGEPAGGEPAGGHQGPLKLVVGETDRRRNKRKTAQNSGRK